MGGLGLVLAGGCGALAGCAAGLLLGAGRPTRVRAPALLAGLGGWAGEFAARLRGSLGDDRARRRKACLDELPVMLDVVTLGLSAGLSFDSSLELYCERYDTELSRALSEAMLSWRLGVRSRDEALLALADELDVPALRRFATVVTESLSFGTPMAEALERQAQAIRDEQRSQVEEGIEQVPVKMLIPMGTLIVPAMFLAILGPLLGPTLIAG